MSNTITLPDPIPYPKILPLEEIVELIGKVVYLIEPYNKGVSTIIKRQDGDVTIRFADWYGNLIDITNPLCYSVLNKYGIELVRIMDLIKINQALFYFNSSEELVDVQISLNKFIGPGMLRDLFSKAINTQKVESIITLDDNEFNLIKNSNNSYIIKSSAFKLISREEEFLPAYATVRHQI